MPTIKLSVFKGMRPSVHPTLLPDGMSQIASNCILKSGKLSPMKDSSPVLDIKTRKMGRGEFSIPDAKSMYLWNRGIDTRTGKDIKELLVWAGDVRVARSNIADDNKFRLFVSGDTGIGRSGGNHPSVVLQDIGGSNIRVRSLVKGILDRPVVERVENDSRPFDDKNIRYTRFFQTWVDDVGYESGTSLPSENIYIENGSSESKDFEYNDGDIVLLKSTLAPVDAVKRRLYKVVTGTETESVQFIIEQDVTRLANGSMVFLDISFCVKDEDAGEIMPTFKSPPEDLVWMTYIENGFYCGFRKSNKRRVLFSEINQPVSFPDAYEYSIADSIVGLVSISNNVFILTDGSPWVISGTSPDAMTVSKIGTPCACVSSRSICVYGNSVFYASNIGVCMLNTNGVVNITSKLWTREQWNKLNPSSCLIGEYDGILFLYFKDSNGRRINCYTLDLSETENILSENNENIACFAKDDETDTLYYIRDGR